MPLGTSWTPFTLVGRRCTSSGELLRAEAGSACSSRERGVVLLGGSAANSLTLSFAPRSGAAVGERNLDGLPESGALGLRLRLVPGVLARLDRLDNPWVRSIDRRNEIANDAVQLVLGDRAVHDPRVPVGKNLAVPGIPREFREAVPEIEGGQKCEAVTTHVDIVPTVLGLAGAPEEQKDSLTKDLVGKDFSPLLASPAEAGINDLRMGGLFAFSMLTTLDADFWVKILDYMHSGKDMAKIKEQGFMMDFSKRGHIRSVFDGRYKFSRYFAPKQHNRPETLKQILEYNDIEMFDLQEDPYEERNLAAEPERNRELVLTMNEKLNALIDEEIGEDIGQMLPGGPDAEWAVTEVSL